MADWTAPFHMPKYTTEEFKEMKAKYVAEHGYTITVPGLSDIVHIGIETKMTEEETRLWKARKYDDIPEPRRSDIRAMKQKRKDKFLAMLGSPTPHIVNNAGSLMTSIDDAQDALATLAFLGKVAVVAAPRMIGAVLSGPVGWTMAIAGMLNMMQHLGYQRLGPKKAKRQKDAATQDNPKSKLQKLAKAAKLKGIFPSQGRIVEALQVSDNIFGIGICLGPLVGFAIETVTGPMRRLGGAKVDVKVPWPILQDFTMTAQRQARSQLAYIGAGLQTTNEEVIGMAMANYLGKQQILTDTQDWNAFDNVEDLDKIELLAPVPDNVLTREVIEEEGINIDNVVGWPHSGKKWSLTSDLMNEYDEPCKKYGQDYMELHDHDWWGYAFGTLSTQATSYTLAAVEGEDQVQYDYTAQSKWTHIMLDNGLVIKEGTSPEKFGLVEKEIERLNEEEEKPTLRNMLDFYKANNIETESFLS